MWKASAPVVVGVDGSDAAIDAAKWAIDEAISRDVPLRIVHVTHIEGAAGLTGGHVPARRPICRIVAARRDRRRGGDWETRQDRNRNPVGLAGHRSDQRVAKRFHGVRRLGWYRRDGQQNVGVNGSKLWPKRPTAQSQSFGHLTTRRPRGPTGSSSLWRITPTTSRSSNTQ